MASKAPDRCTNFQDPLLPGAQGRARLGYARVFVAIRPDAIARDRLDGLAESLAAGARHSRRVAKENLHLTLAFIGTLEEQRARSVARALLGCRARAFEWTIDRVGYFAGARVVWGGGPESLRLQDLADRVRGALRALDVTFDNRPFVPHVTLLRDVSGLPPGALTIDPAIAWRCDGPVLLRSTAESAGVRYVPVDSGASQGSRNA